jgi:hypothetical protein
MKRAQNARRDTPTERADGSTHFDFRDGSLLQFDHRFAAVVADYASEEVPQVRVMAYQQNGILAAIFFQHSLKIRESGLRTERGFGHQFAFVTHFVPDQSGGLHGALQGTGDDNLDLNTERGEGAANVSALLDAVFIEGALLISLGAAQHSLAGAGVA